MRSSRRTTLSRVLSLPTTSMRSKRHLLARLDLEGRGRRCACSASRSGERRDVGVGVAQVLEDVARWRRGRRRRVEREKSSPVRVWSIRFRRGSSPSSSPAKPILPMVYCSPSSTGMVMKR